MSARPGYRPYRGFTVGDVLTMAGFWVVGPAVVLGLLAAGFLG